MDIGLLFRFGKPVPGREQKAVELFTEATEYWMGKMADGVITYFEPFFFVTTDTETETGFMIVKGPAPEVYKLIEDEAFLTLSNMALFLVEHFRWDLITVGDRVTEQIDRSEKVRIDLGVT